MDERRETAVHRALADERRARIVEELRGAQGGLDVQELSRRLGLHPNTIRWHLGILEDAGIVDSAPAERSAPGRPRILYRLQPEVAAGARDEYRLLATILTGAAAQEADAEERAAQAGWAWGRYLVRRPLPAVRVKEAEAVAEVARVLEQQGFAPEVEGREIRMCRCPFAELASTYQEVVCSVHRGLISGVLHELGSDLAVESLDAFVRPDLCIARLGSA